MWVEKSVLQGRVAKVVSRGVTLAVPGRRSRYTSPTCLDPTQPAALTLSLLSCIAPISRYHVRTGARNELGNMNTEPAELESRTWGLRGREGHTGTCHSNRCRHSSPASVSPPPFNPTFPHLGREKKHKARGTHSSVLNVVQAAPTGEGEISHSSPEGF